MRFLVLWSLLLVSPLGAEAVWVLKSGPVAVTSIPLDPVQMVSAWRGQYGDGTDTVWLYATRSPQFFPPRIAGVFGVDGTPWKIVLFVPGHWTPAERQLWSDRWVAEFRTLISLPEPGYPIVFPSILRKG